jgi:hypothetical protein
MISPILNPTGYLLGVGLKKVFDSIYESDSSMPLATLKEDALRAEIKAQVILSEAKVEQEKAIAQRILNAEEVEIEEYYDTSGKGNIGLNVKEDSFSAGLGGEGRKVTKRIIKFKGYSPVIQLAEPKKE